MSKKHAVLYGSVFAVAVLVIGFILLYQRFAPSTGTLSKEERLKTLQEDLNQTFDEASQLPSINAGSNPLGKLPDVNPVEQANPFSDLNTNPFR